MSSRYSSSSSSYEPLSPPWGPPAPYYEVPPPRAPVMPYKPLPPTTPPALPSPHQGLITPPPSPEGGIHPLLSADPTIVRYDFKTAPHTLRMSSSSRTAVFPTTHLASTTPYAAINIECESSRQVVPVRNDHGVTCGDIMHDLHAYFAQRVRSDELRYVPEPQRGLVSAAHARRTAQQPDHVRRIDFLNGNTVFRRLVPKHGTRSSTPTWVLQTTW